MKDWQDQPPPTTKAVSRSRAAEGGDAPSPDDLPVVPRRRVGHKNRVRIGSTRVGKGVFAGKWYRIGEIVGEITGEVIREEGYGSEYCMDLEDGTCLEPAAPFRYLNHSCEPNCSFTWHDLREEGLPGIRRRMFLYVLRPIRAGDELTIDYAWPAWFAIPCRCGAATCRGWVVAEEELVTITQRGDSPAVSTAAVPSGHETAET